MRNPIILTLTSDPHPSFSDYEQNKNENSNGIVDTAYSRKIGLEKVRGHPDSNFLNLNFYEL